jgi:ElaB/YqjD/DUF883 family membrane-anchored ribosome-binding protein
MASRVETEGFAPAGLNEDDVAASMDAAEREAEQAVRTAKQKLEGAYERTSRVATKAYHEALDFAYEKPAVAALVTFGAGLTMGYMLSNGRSRDYRGRIVPAIATALAEAVHEVFNGRA